MAEETKKKEVIDALKLMKAVVPLINEKWVDPQKILQICEEFTRASSMQLEDAVEIKILFLTGLLNEVIKPIPLRLYRDPETRENLIETVQEIINNLVEQEEELYADDEFEEFEEDEQGDK